MRLLSLLIVLSLGACGATCEERPYSLAEDPAYAVHGDAEIEVRLAWIEVRTGPRVAREIGVYVDRPGAPGRRPGARERGVASDLPSALRPRLVQISLPSEPGPHRGVTCDRVRVPFACPLPPAAGGRVRIKVLFDDHRHGEAEIEVPATEPIAEPELLAPTTQPAQGAPLEVAFRDVGADHYAVTVSLCRPYRGDGIDPCLDERRFSIGRGPGGLALAEGDRATLAVEGRRVTLGSGDAIRFEEHVSYRVTAERRQELDGVEVRWHAESARRFPPR